MIIHNPELPPLAGYVEVIDENGQHIYQPTPEKQAELEAAAKAEAAAADMQAVKLLSTLTLSGDDSALVQNDNQRLEMLQLYPAYTYDEAVEEGWHRRYAAEGEEEKLYKCRQAHTTQEGWEPPLTSALWAAVNRTNAGTIDDPIPAERGMEYEYGKYYLDPEDGLAYLCERGSETGTIVLQYLPHELVGQYFTLAEVSA